MKTISEPKTYAIFAGGARRKLIDELENDGAKIFQFEPLKTEKINSDPNILKVIEDLKDFDWLIFTDVFAVDYFIEILIERETDLFELDDLRVLACGEAVADRLRFVQLHADIITASEDENALFSALSQYIGETEIAGAKFLFLTESNYASGLKARLIGAGASAETLPVYKIIVGEKGQISKLKTLLKGGAIDEFIFASPEDVLCAKHYVSPEVLPVIFSETICAGINDITVRALTENDLPAVRFHRIKRG